MKRYLLTLFIGLAMILVACDGDAEEKEVSSVETSQQDDEKDRTESEVETEEDAEGEQEETQEINKVLADNEHVKATMVNIIKVEDKEWDEEKYEINIEIENKREDTIEVQAHEVSADDIMIDDMVFFSETVAGGKKSNAKMIIENYEGDLPKMENNLEFVLDIFSHDDYDFEDKHDVKIEF